MRTEFAPLFKLGRAERLQLVEISGTVSRRRTRSCPCRWKREELRRRKERFSQHPSSAGPGSRSSSGRERDMIERVVYTPDRSQAYSWYEARGWARSCGAEACGSYRQRHPYSIRWQWESGGRWFGGSH